VKRRGAVLFSLVVLRLAGQDLSDQIRAAQSTGDYPKAASLYSKLIASGQDTPEIQSNLGTMLYLSGRDQDALPHLRSALSRNPDLVAANLFTGLALSRLNRWKEALPYLESAHRREKSSIVPVLGLAKAYLALRDYEHANQSYSDAAKLDPDSAEAWFGVGVTSRSLADGILRKHQPSDEAPMLLKRALEALTRAVALEPDSPRSHLLLAESLRDSGSFVDALAEYNKAIRLSPGDPAPMLGLATTYWKSGDSAQALPLLEQVLRRLPDDPEANGILANILVRQGSYDSALPHATKALRGNPDLTQVRFSLAKIYLAQERPQLAVNELRKIAPSDVDGSFHFLLASALKKMGRNTDADAAIEKFKQLRGVP
jgi:tetratricopeptide (TPR) repeat protein